MDNTKENCDDNHSTHSRSDEPAPKDTRETTINGSDKDSVNDDAVLDNRRDVGTRSSRSASPEYNPPVDDYPPVSDHIRLDLLRCRDELFDLVSDLCDENVHLSDMYEEIRRSPLAAEMKEEYESTIQSLEDEIASLKGNYDKLYEDHLLLKEDYESLQRTYHNLCDQSKSDLEASENRCAAISKECDLAQEKVNQLREANCNLEAQLSEERKKLREANLTIHRLQRDANASETSLSRRSVVDVDRSAEPVSSTVHEPRDNDDALSVSSSRRIPSDSASQTSYRDRYPSRFSPRTSRQDMIVVSRGPSYRASHGSSRGPSRGPSYGPSQPPSQPLQAPRETMAVALYDYEGGSGSLPLKRGMRMTLLKYSDAGDWAYVSINGKKTWEPASYLEVQSPSQPEEKPLPPPEEKPSPKSAPAPVPAASGLLKRALVIAGFEGEESVEMSVRKGEVISVLKKDADWLLGEVGSRKGWVPVSFVQFL